MIDIQRWSKRQQARQRGRAKKRGVVSSLTADQLVKQYNDQEGNCYWCKASLDDTMHIDHIVPMSKQGANTIENVVIACRTCNLYSYGHMRPANDWLINQHEQGVALKAVNLNELYAEHLDELARRAEIKANFLERIELVAAKEKVERLERQHRQLTVEVKVNREWAFKMRGWAQLHRQNTNG